MSDGWGVVNKKKKPSAKKSPQTAVKHELEYMKQKTGEGPPRERKRDDRDKAGFNHRRRGSGGATGGFNNSFSNDFKRTDKGEGRRNEHGSEFKSWGTRERGDWQNKEGGYNSPKAFGRGGRGYSEKEEKTGIPLEMRTDADLIETLRVTLRDTDVERNSYSLHYLLGVRASLQPTEPMEGAPRAGDAAFLGVLSPRSMRQQCPGVTLDRIDVSLPAAISKNSPDENETGQHRDEPKLTFDRGVRRHANPESQVLTVERIDPEKLLAEEHLDGDSFVRRHAMMKNDANSTKMRQRKLQGMLNKLNVKNFDSIVAKVASDDGICTEDHLLFFLELTFEKAAHMPNFLELYARLLMSIRAPIAKKEFLKNDNRKKKNVSQEELYALLVTRSASDAYVKFMSEVVFDEEEENDEMAQLEAMNRRKDQRRGLAVFVCELVTVQLVRDRILGMILLEIKQDLQERNIEFLIRMCESLFKKEPNDFLDFTGNAQEKLKKYINDYADELKKAVNVPGISVRLKALIDEQILEWNKTTCWI